MACELAIPLGILGFIAGLAIISGLVAIGYKWIDRWEPGYGIYRYNKLLKELRRCQDTCRRMEAFLEEQQEKDLDNNIPNIEKLFPREEDK